MASSEPGLDIMCLSERNAHHAEAFFAADCQIRDHDELLPAIVRVCLDLVARSHRRFRRHDLHRAIRLAVNAGFADFCELRVPLLAFATRADQSRECGMITSVAAAVTMCTALMPIAFTSP